VSIIPTTRLSPAISLARTGHLSIGAYLPVSIRGLQPSRSPAPPIGRTFLSAEL
jgi:hypothetical protein